MLGRGAKTVKGACARLEPRTGAVSGCFGSIQALVCAGKLVSSRIRPLSSCFRGLIVVCLLPSPPDFRKIPAPIWNGSNIHS